MIKYTDAVLRITLPDLDLTGASSIKVTIAQGSQSATKDATAEALEEGGCRVTAAFVQTDTGGFNTEDFVEVQINYWISGKRSALKPVRIDFYKNLISEVMN